MKTSKLIFKWSLPILLGGLVTMTSCGDDGETVPVPTADFTSVVDGKTVTFTDASTDAESYLWEFGDGETSTEMSTSHTYEANGSYVVKLTVTNESGEDSKQEVFEIINISIDGSFDDWADVQAVTGGGGTVTSMKIENLENNKLYIYVEGTELTPLAQIFLNTDNDLTTGAFIDWYYATSGEDILIEGNLAMSEEQYGSVIPCEPCDGSNPGNWNWSADPVTDVIADFIEASEIKSVSGGMAYELAIDLTALGKTISSEAIGVAVLDISLETWSSVGAIPALYNENDNPDAALYLYEFK
ncbi:PKD domain-containing protein [Marinoscillum sp.]|uniref:PKD domain-containing protein n=1 Tax=Marinoscillum sp. TaxID=2024838 RepID=UPI003BA9B6F1